MVAGTMGRRVEDIDAGLEESNTSIAQRQGFRVDHIPFDRRVLDEIEIGDPLAYRQQ